MDPPTSSSTSSRILNFHRTDHHEPTTTTPKSKNKNTNQPTHRSSSPHLNILRSQRSSSSTDPLHKSRNVAKIIKGEIHNVLTVMRSDPRYYSTSDEANTTGRQRSRFDFEERQHHGGRMGRFWSSNNNDSGTYRGMMKRLNDTNNAHLSTTTGSFAIHPILQGLRDLYDVLSSMESEFVDAGKKNDGKLFSINAEKFVAPFAAAVCSPDVDAKTTGAALSALHKFIVYGFLEGHSSSSAEAVRESITMVAKCIPKCSFEESSAKTASGGSKGVLSFWSLDKKEEKKSGSFMLNRPPTSLSDEDNEVHNTQQDLPQFLLHPRRHRAPTGGAVSKPATLSSEDENVVLKLLSLSVQVLRCSAGRSFLSPSDIIGIFDTCLFVSLASEEAKHSLLRSAAADALSHCVIVVFGMGAGRQVSTTLRRSDIVPDDDTADPTTEDASDSDDDWGERDPTLGLEDSVLVKRGQTNNSPPINNDVRPQTEGACELIDNQHADGVKEEEPALVAIMARLAAMADPLIHEDDTCVLSLSLINIALETMNDVDALASKYPRLLSTMQNDLCRNLLRLSTSPDLTLLGLALRVIFNLFNGIKHHLKVQLEVFLTSVHLRMLSSSTSPTTHQQVWSSSPEHRELALESLLEFCREPMLMMDLYLNYDCDINCTNLFETIMVTLARVANPDEGLVDTQHIASGESKLDDDDDLEDASQKPRLNILNRLALEGLIAVINSISKRCHLSSKFPILPFGIVGSLPGDSILIDPMRPSPPDSGNLGILGNTLCINSERDYDFCSLSSSSDMVTPIKARNYNLRTNSDMSDVDFDLLSNAEHHTSLALRERKIRKRRLAKAATFFNESSRDKEWIAELERLGVVPNPATPESVAAFLHSTSEKLDKTKIGEYISKGPKEKYPFIEKVLHEFAQLFDFTGLSFSEALRLFLSTFRLPGEAQCIDRLMEVFAQRLYDVQSSCQPDDNAEKTMLDPPHISAESESSSRNGLIDPPTSDDTHDILLPFRSADAAFILAFSTIMLNTDLHNPNMDDAKRMTLEQFIRNNRGINDGTDLPLEFLQELYYEIKNNEIKMKEDDDNLDLGNFDGLLVEKANISAPFFTSSNSAQSKFVQAGLHERDMFVAISAATTRAISTVFVQSWDDALVMKALNGLRSSANICAYFGLHQELDELVDLLLSWGQDYVSSVTQLMYSEPKIIHHSNNLDAELPAAGADEKLDFAGLDADLMSRDLPVLPAAFMAALKENNSDQVGMSDADDVAGSAAHRGLLSLHYALVLCKNHFSIINEALPSLLEVIFALRDVDALPPRLADLDDFADSKGNSLGPSKYAKNSLERMQKYKDSLSPSPEPSSSGGFLSMFSFGNSSSQGAKSVFTPNTNPLIAVLNAVCNNASVDQIIMKTNDVAVAKRVLTAMLSSMYPDEEDAGLVSELLTDPQYEENAAFVLELAARLLISNREHSTELLPIFLAKFEVLFTPNQDDVDGAAVLGMKFPYLMERIMVTVLRAVIHLYDLPDKGLRIHLVQLMNLLSRLPFSYMAEVSNRLGCGAAIVLRGCFFLFESPQEWSAIKTLLDMAAQHESGRPFVFDGIASLVDYLFPVEGESEVKLSTDGSEAISSLLLKFMEGSYDNDTYYKLPSMMYMKRVYSRQQSGSESFPSSSVGQDSNPEPSLEWTNMVKIMYNDLCLSENTKTSKKGFESLQEVLLSTKVDSIPDAQWLTLMKMASTNPPPPTSQEARMDSLKLVGRLFLTLMPELSNRKGNWSFLEEFTLEVARIVGENLRSGRSSSLFESTVHTVTNICNVMSMSDFSTGNGINFCSWVGETLLCELEKVGACGGVDASLVGAFGSAV